MENKTNKRPLKAIWVDEKYLPVLDRIKGEAIRDRSHRTSYRVIVEDLIWDNYKDYFKCENLHGDCGSEENRGACVCYVD